MAHFEDKVSGIKKLIHTIALFCVFWAVGSSKLKISAKKGRKKIFSSTRNGVRKMFV
jgi:hypothetical protein